MSHRVSFLALACLSGLAGQALAAPQDAGDEAPVSDQISAAPAISVSGRTARGAVSISRGATDLAAVHVARAADGEGQPVGMVALPSGATAAAPSRPRRTRVSSGFGYRIHPLAGGVRFHAGIDLPYRTGTAVIAANDGVVVQAGWAAGYGLLVTIDHGHGLQTRYGHLSSLGVAPGQRIHRGDLLGAVGSTGRSTGPHLHYEVRLNGQPISPLPPRSGQ
jgi:murein DD-endopeptidase MepM/ murein hydrolase activator NlpD